MDNTGEMQSLPQLAIVVAVAENGVIGRGDNLPWRLSGDLQRFKRLTMGHALIMGRKTYASIGRPLPGRVTIVLTRQTDYRPNDPRVLVASGLEQAQQSVTTTDMNHERAFVVGGAQIYQLALPDADRLYYTRVHAAPVGDVRFPPVDWNQWGKIESVDYPSDAKNEHAVTWEVWQRRRIAH